MKIPDKFIDADFANFILNINVLEENGRAVDKRSIKDAFGSVEEWADYYQLASLHGIALDDILKLFRENCCARVFRKANYIQYNDQNLASLETEIRARLLPKSAEAEEA